MSALPAPPPTPDLIAFTTQTGRLPRLGDAVAPWRYRGWLLWYVIEIHARHPDVPDRWGYYFRTREAGRLLDEPIPQIRFLDGPDHEAMKQLDGAVSIIEHRYGSFESFRRLVDWLAFALAVSDEDRGMDHDTEEKLYRQFNVGPVVVAPYDHLGTMLSERKSNKWNNTGFYPTPHNVVECMVQMTFGDGDHRAKTVCDPCIGTGRMLLHASNYSLRLHGQDIDPLVLSICKINGALYAPWMSFSFPKEVFDAVLEQD